MGSFLRKMSRKIHPEAWDRFREFRAIRRLTQLKLRAEGRGDKVTALRAKILLNQIRELGVFDPETAAKSNENNPVFQKKESKDGPRPINRVEPGRPFVAGADSSGMAGLDNAHPKGRRGS